MPVATPPATETNAEMERVWSTESPLVVKAELAQRKLLVALFPPMTTPPSLPSCSSAISTASGNDISLTWHSHPWY
jgi:hypothetical protein